MFAGMVLADVEEQDHVPLDFCEADPDMAKAFEIGGQGKMSAEQLESIRKHRSVVYLHFPLDLADQRERVLKYTQVIQRLGGLAVKLESAGVAHAWDRWFGLLTGTPFDMYCAAVVLVGDRDYYYSCGMHHFGLPDCEVPRSMSPADAAELINQFNFWQIVEKPKLDIGHTFSVAAEAPRFRLSKGADPRHEEEDLFHNPQGLWRLNGV